MFNYLTMYEGPVVEGLERFEKAYAETQDQYHTLRTLPGENGLSAISRWTPTEQQRAAIGAGADILLEVMHFRQDLQPVRLMVTDGRGEHFKEWFAVQTRAPYLSALGEENQCKMPPRVKPADEPTRELSFQERVRAWVEAAFGRQIADDRAERNHRFLEEALELVQSLKCSREDAHRLVDYVFNRPAGDPRQELGGVLLTVAALASACLLNMENCGEAELARVWANINQIRRK
jgi:hypothetical protein